MKRGSYGLFGETWEIKMNTQQIENEIEELEAEIIRIEFSHDSLYSDKPAYANYKALKNRRDELQRMVRSVDET